MFLRVLTVIIFFALCNTPGIAQNGLVAYYNMDDCGLNDSEGTSNGFIFGSNPCVCGVSANGIGFDGINTFGGFDQGLNEIIKGDWTMSLYIQVQNVGGAPIDLLFMGERCGLDSVLSLRYLPDSDRFRFLLSDTDKNSVKVDGLADQNSCWQYVAITKTGATVGIFINGNLAEEASATSVITFDINATLSISNSPCQNIAILPDVKLRGAIDEFRIYDRVLTDREILNANLRPDKILTRDTTIFIGESIRILTGGTCYDDFTWSPTTDLEDANMLNPVASPDEDMTYTLTVNGQDCSSIDEVNIRVADPSVVGCADLLLPSAFTPNNDLTNDFYGISNQFLISTLESFEIFNRWGGRVFYTNETSGTWDGSYKGTPAPASSYVYKVVYGCENQTYTKTGVVNLIR